MMTPSGMRPTRSGTPVEYSRRHHAGDSISAKFKSKNEEAFGALTMEYELEASAVLALRQTIAAYRKLRPDAE